MCCVLTARSVALVLLIFAQDDGVLSQNPRMGMNVMPMKEDLEAAMALAEAFKEQIGVGAAVDPARAMGEEKG